VDGNFFICHRGSSAFVGEGRTSWVLWKKGQLRGKNVKIRITVKYRKVTPGRGVRTPLDCNGRGGGGKLIYDAGA